MALSGRGPCRRLNTALPSPRPGVTPCILPLASQDGFKLGRGRPDGDDAEEGEPASVGFGEGSEDNRACHRNAMARISISSRNQSAIRCGRWRPRGFIAWPLAITLFGFFLLGFSVQFLWILKPNPVGNLFTRRIVTPRKNFSVFNRFGHIGIDKRAEQIQSRSLRKEILSVGIGQYQVGTPLWCEQIFSRATWSDNWRSIEYIFQVAEPCRFIPVPNTKIGMQAFNHSYSRASILNLKFSKDPPYRTSQVDFRLIEVKQFRLFDRVIVKCCGLAGHDQAASLGSFSVD